MKHIPFKFRDKPNGITTSISDNSELANAVDSRKTIIKGINLGNKTVIICRRSVFKRKLYFYTPARNSHLQK